MIPAAYREALGVAPGDELIVILEDDELRIVTARQAVKRARRLVRKHIPEGTSLVGELLADRRTEAAGE